MRIGRGKIQRVGGGDYIIVPIIYRESQNLRKGDVLEMFYEGGDELIIRPRRKQNQNDDGGE